jgi:hypothetical protein
VLIAFAAAAWSDAYQARPVRLVVPEPARSTPEEFRRFFLAEIKRYAEIVRDAKIQSE